MQAVQSAWKRVTGLFRAADAETAGEDPPIADLADLVRAHMRPLSVDGLRAAGLRDVVSWFCSLQRICADGEIGMDGDFTGAQGAGGLRFVGVRLKPSSNVRLAREYISETVDFVGASAWAVHEGTLVFAFGPREKAVWTMRPPREHARIDKREPLVSRDIVRNISSQFLSGGGVLLDRASVSSVSRVVEPVAFVAEAKIVRFGVRADDNALEVHVFLSDGGCSGVLLDSVRNDVDVEFCPYLQSVRFLFRNVRAASAAAPWSISIDKSSEPGLARDWQQHARKRAPDRNGLEHLDDDGPPATKSTRYGDSSRGVHLPGPSL